MVPNSVIRRFTIQLLLARDFAYEYNVIYTEIEPDYIFKFRDYSLMETGYLANTPVRQQDRSEEKYTVIPSRLLRGYYFGEADSIQVGEFDIALSDWGVARRTMKPLTGLIQLVALRSPRSADQGGVNTKTDWWNLGAVILEVFRAVRMFSGCVLSNGPYQRKEHLNEIVDLFGPCLKTLLKKGDIGIVQVLFNEDGKIKDAAPLEQPGWLRTLSRLAWMTRQEPSLYRFYTPL